MDENNTEEVIEKEKPEKEKPEKEVLTSSQKRRKILLEFVDMLKGAAFPVVAMCIFSSLIIILMDYTDELGIQILAVAGGDVFVIASMFIFGRTNGSEAYKTSISNKVKREINAVDEKVLLRTGEYAPWKGFVIGLISAVPFIILEAIYCGCHADIADFILRYSSGWAVGPFDLAEGIPDALDFVMVLLPVVLLGCSYLYGKRWERKRQEKIKRSEDARRKGKKKDYYGDRGGGKNK